MSEPNRHHDDGERDRSNGKDYSPPHDVTEDVLDFFNPFSGTNGFQERHDDNEAYRKGWDNNEKQEDEKSGGCFLTTACTDYSGLPDNCHELVTLRRFRDTYLLTNPKTRPLVDEYYQRAPKLVSIISSSPTATSEFADIFKRIVGIVDMIEKNQFEDALNQYKQMFNELSEKYGK